MKKFIAATITTVTLITLPLPAIAQQKVLWCQTVRVLGHKMFSYGCEYITPQEAQNRQSNKPARVSNPSYSAKNGIRVSRQDCLLVGGTWSANIKLCTLND